MNRAIRVPEVRVVNNDGQQLGVMSTDAARDIASRIGLDLVEISPNGDPPVCKIMDYGRYKYEQQKKASQAKKSQHQSQLKEVKFRPRIDDHDLEFKLKNARRFLFEGDKVKATVMFRGREIVHTAIGRELLERVTEHLSEFAKPESRPQMEGRMLTMIFAPDRQAIERIKRAEAKESGSRSESEEGAASGEEAERTDASQDKEQSLPKRSGSSRARSRGETLEDEAQALLEEIDRA
ncbi:MAG: translation initiation factor IF-3 [Proteobacteria bacterium]|nr:translation initiation factor IF-3 [Pseudomonadota bacterium]